MSLLPKGQTIKIGRVIHGVEAARLPGSVPPGPITPGGPPGQEAKVSDYDRGRAAGIHEAQAQAAASAALLAKLMEAVKTEALKMPQQMDRLATLLSVRIAARIIGREVADEAAIKQMIAAALGQVPMRGPLTIRLNPLDAQLFESLRGKAIVGETSLPSDVVLTPDPAIARGGCILENLSGKLDARIETQLKLIEQALQPATKHPENYGD